MNISLVATLFAGECFVKIIFKGTNFKTISSEKYLDE